MLLTRPLPAADSCAGRMLSHGPTDKSATQTHPNVLSRAWKAMELLQAFEISPVGRKMLESDLDWDGGNNGVTADDDEDNIIEDFDETDFTYLDDDDDEVLARGLSDSDLFGGGYRGSKHSSKASATVAAVEVTQASKPIDTEKIKR